MSELFKGSISAIDVTEITFDQLVEICKNMDGNEMLGIAEMIDPDYSGTIGKDWWAIICFNNIKLGSLPKYMISWFGVDDSKISRVVDMTSDRFWLKKLKAGLDARNLIHDDKVLVSVGDLLDLSFVKNSNALTAILKGGETDVSA